MEIEHHDFTSEEARQKREILAKAFRYLCEQHPIPPLPYPDTKKKLKRLKALMKTQKNRERWQQQIAATLTVTRKMNKVTSWTTQGMTATPLERRETYFVLHHFNYEYIAMECKLPVNELLAVKVLIWG